MTTIVVIPAGLKPGSIVDSFIGSGLRIAGTAVLVFSIFFLSMYVSASPKEEAQAAWQHREDQAGTVKAIHLWEEALKTNPDNAIYIDLARACGRAYRHSEGSERVIWADKAKKYGEYAVRLNPDNSEAYAQYAAALGQWAQAHKGLHSLRIVKQAVKILQKSISINPRHAYSHMLLAEFYRDSPRNISVGDKRLALIEATKAVECAPTWPEYHLCLAKCFLALGKRNEGRVELEKTLQLPAPPDYGPETQSQKESAKELLKTL